MVITFSALIISYKRREFLLDAVMSVINQNYSRDLFEIVVVKGFSDKDLEKELERYNVKTLFCDSPSNGKSIAIGIQECSNDIICLLDDDDIFAENKFQVLSEAFEREPDVNLMINDYYRIDKSGHSIEINQPPIRLKESRTGIVDLNKNHFDLKMAHKFDIYFNSSRLSFRNRNLDELSDYIKRISYGVDNAIVMYYLFRTTRIAIIREKVTAYRMHEKNISRIENYENPLSDLSRITKKEIESVKNIENYLLEIDKGLINHLELLEIYLSLKLAYTEQVRELIFKRTVEIAKFYISHVGKMKSYGFYQRLYLYVFRDILSLPIFLILPERMAKFRLKKFY
ncbi:glycosyltransferase [Cuniculiplasma sp. SKW3]|uniref:glycosyltransferase n=1 Tax=unclassified Cuniculiplasma TaxID=2619706 RepID=UPI003FD36FE3